MEKMFTIDECIALRNKISEITSINVEREYGLNGSNLEGNFLVSGTYKAHGLSFNQEQFNFKIPFECNIDNLEESTVKIEIDDFNYDVNENEINISIEYYLLGEEKKEERVVEPLIEEKEILEVDLDEEKHESNFDNLPDSYVTYIIYTVKENENLVTIANNFKTSVEEINEYNEIKELKEGIKLVIPYHE